MDIFDRITTALTIVGALNWGLVGAFGFDLVAAIGGGPAGMVSRVIYIVVGLCGLWCVGAMFRRKKGDY